MSIRNEDGSLACICHEHKPECDCVPEPSPLSTAQQNFLRLHVKHSVDMWQWHFCKTQLRAHVGLRRATIWRHELDDLIARGLMFKGLGATVYATSDGKALIP